MSWTLKIENTEHTLESLAACEASLARFSLAPDEFKITSSRPFIAANGDYMELIKDGVRRFCGRLFRKRSVHTPGGEKFEYEFRGPWQGLREIQYAQEWGEKSSAGSEVKRVSKSRVVFGYDYDGERIGILRQAEMILECAKNGGLEFEAELDFDDFNIPAEEMTDLNCEEALMRCLRWSTDLVGHFDYSCAGKPRLSIAKRGALDTLTLDADVKFKRVTHCEREDMRVQGVCVIYERDNHVGGELWTQTQREIYPPGAVENGIKCVTHTIKLAGITTSVQSCPVETAKIEEDSAEWWKSKFPSLSDPKITKIQISDVKRDTTLPRELVSGRVYDWMMKSAKKDVIRADIACYDGEKKISLKKYTYRCVATDASTYNYAREIFMGTEESVPFGLAKAIYDSSSQSLIEGEAAIADAENLELAGRRISIPGKFDGAVVVSSVLDIFSKTLTARYGPPKHLYVSDIGRLFKLARSRKAPANTNRSSGISPSSNASEDGGTGSEQGAFSDYKSIAQLEISDSDESESKVTLSIYDIDKSDAEKKLDVRLRKTVIVHNGVPKYAYVLMSQPFDM